VNGTAVERRERPGIPARRAFGRHRVLPVPAVRAVETDLFFFLPVRHVGPEDGDDVQSFEKKPEKMEPVCRDRKI